MNLESDNFIIKTLIFYPKESNSIFKDNWGEDLETLLIQYGLMKKLLSIYTYTYKKELIDHIQEIIFYVEQKWDDIQAMEDTTLKSVLINLINLFREKYNMESEKD